MRRSTRVRGAASVCALSVALGLGALVPAAQAADGSGNSTVTWRPGAAPPAGTGFWSNSCSTDAHANLHQKLDDDASGVAAGRTVVAGESAGDAAWQYAPGSGVQGGPSLKLSDPGSVTAVTVRARSAGPAAVGGRLLAFYRAPNADADEYFVGEAPISVSGSGWQKVDASRSMTWYKHATPLLPLPIFSEWSTLRKVDSIPAFTGSKSFKGGTMLVGYQLGCSAAPFDLDHLQVVTKSGTTDYDLSNQSTTTTVTADTGKVRSGGQVTLTGTVTGAVTGRIDEGSVVVQARPYGKSTFTQVATADLANGSAVVEPSGTTSYRWRFRGTPDAAASTSEPVTVRVITAVSAKLRHSTVTKGKRFRLTGTANPAHRGAKVTVQRRIGSKWRAIGTTKTTRHGRFSFAAKAGSAGDWLLRARVARTDGDLAGRSAKVRLRVKAPTTVRAELSRSTVTEGKRFRVTGSARPRVPGARVRLQRHTASGWQTIDSARTNSKGRFGFREVADSRGSWKLRVLVAGSTYTRSVKSAVLRLTVAAAPVPPPPPPPPSSGGGTGGGTGGGGGTGVGGGGGGTGIG